jgi:hypothetical protein
MGEVGAAMGNFLNDAFTIGTMGLVDLKKGRVYVPFSGASARAGARAVAGSSADVFYGFQGKSSEGARRTMNAAIDSPEGRLAGTAAATASAIGVGYYAGPTVGVSATTGAVLGGLAGQGIAYGEALNQPTPRVPQTLPMPGPETRAVQTAVAEGAARRARASGYRSTILSQNYLAPASNGLKSTLGS